MNYYCIHCKKNTKTLNVKVSLTKNNRNIIRGKCLICGKIKTRFIKKNAFQKGGSFLNKLINNLPFEMHLPGHNFTGPGTNLKKRLKPDGTPKSWSKPINRVDKAAMKHDICYSTNKDTNTRNKICDRNMINDLKNITNPSLRERIETGIVKKIIGTKKNFAL